MIIRGHFEICHEVKLGVAVLLKSISKFQSFDKVTFSKRSGHPTAKNLCLKQNVLFAITLTHLK